MSAKLVSTSVQEEIDASFVFCAKTSELDDADNVFRQISQAFDGEPHLLGVPPDQLAASFEAGLSMVVLSAGRPVGYARLIQLTEPDSPDGEWYELGSIWVDPDFRKHRICTRMCEEFISRHTEKNILSTTTNAVFLAIVMKLHFLRIPRRSLPESVWKASCTCSSLKTGAKDNSTCAMAFSESQQSKSPCWYVVTRATAGRLGMAP